MGATSNLLWQVLVQVLIVLFLVVAVSGLAVGVGLIASSQKTVQLFHRVNRWVSTRHVLKSVEVPRETDRFAHRHQRWVAGAFVLGGLIAIFGLAAGVDANALSLVFAEKRFVPVAAIAFDSAKWFLMVGSTFGVVIGGMLLFYPNAESTLERFANQWVSPRRDSKLGRYAHDARPPGRSPSDARRLDRRQHFGGCGDLRDRHAGALLLTRAGPIGDRREAAAGAFTCGRIA